MIMPCGRFTGVTKPQTICRLSVFLPPNCSQKTLVSWKQKKTKINFWLTHHAAYWTTEERKSLTQQLKSQICSPKRWCRPKQSKNGMDECGQINDLFLHVCWLPIMWAKFQNTVNFYPNFYTSSTNHHYYSSYFLSLYMNMNNKSLKKRFGNYKRNIQQGSVTDFYSTPQSTSHNTHHSQKHFRQSAFYRTDNLRF